MSQVSKFLLTEDVWNRIFNLFIETLIDIKDKSKLRDFVDNFFTPTEKIVFAKRLAAAVMLSKENSYQDIRRTLRISPPTIARMSMQLKYKGEGLSKVIENILKKDATRIIWEEFTSILDIPGKGRNLTALSKEKRARKAKINKLKKEF
ncbi:MAG: Trp family transcriptional regulator [Patescibacteria group bacterium]